MAKGSTRIALLLVAIAILTAYTGLTFWRQHAGGVANAAGLKSAIAGKVAALNLPTRTAELPTETARKLRDAVKQGDFAAADKIYADVLAGSHVENWRFYPFADFIDGIVDLHDPAFASGLDAWVGKDANDPAARLIRARYYFDLAWARRGHDYINKTAADKQAAFKTYTDRALADSDAALGLDPANPYAYLLKLRIFGGAGASQQMVQAFQEAIAKYPAYYPLYTLMLEKLQPKWGGSVQSMYGFVDHYAGGAGDGAPLKLLYVSLYRYLLETAATACYSGNLDGDKLATCVSSNMKSVVTPELGGAIRTALQLYDRTDKYQFGLAVDEIVRKMMQWTGGETLTGGILEIVADAMHSNTELTPDKPATNSYVIDSLVAQSWYRKGFYDNALTKAREALKDIDAATFPSAAEKDRAIAGIVEQIGAVYGHLGQYADMIAYEQAAVSLGDVTREEQYICYGYYQLKDYDDAIRFCTRSIDHGANVMAARYWRGTVYTKKGDREAALKDLTVVAASDNELRASAAIDMSMIYFGQKDNRGALDVLNRYDYLYDPAKVDKQSVAVAYNNRCYAYMELGELKKALSDCTESLKYGAIPDAYSKQLKLMKLLGTS